MPVSITIEDVPDDVRDELDARARHSGCSLQDYVRAELTALARHPDNAVLVERIRQRKQHTGSTLSAEEILRYRDAGR